MKPKTDRKKLIDRCDDAAREIAKKRAKGRCQYSGCCNKGEEVHHLMSRRHLSVRFDPDNLILL
jgi:hypothetical protein